MVFKVTNDDFMIVVELFCLECKILQKLCSKLQIQYVGFETKVIFLFVFSLVIYFILSLNVLVFWWRFKGQTDFHLCFCVLNTVTI